MAPIDLIKGHYYETLTERGEYLVKYVGRQYTSRDGSDTQSDIFKILARSQKRQGAPVIIQMPIDYKHINKEVKKEDLPLYVGWPHHTEFYKEEICLKGG